MALAGSDIHFYYSGAASGGDPQPDPDASLGGNRSSSRVDALQSTTTALMTSPHEFVDGSRAGLGDDFTDDWVVFVTGDNAVSARRVAEYDEPTGTYRFARGWDALAASGDAYRVCQPHDVFDDVSAPDCAAGRVDHRALWFRNQTGEIITGVRAYLVALEPRSTLLELAVSSRASGTSGTFNFPGIAAATDPPPIRGAPSGLFTADGHANEFRDPRARSTAADTPPDGGDTLSPNDGSPFWIRRIVDPLTRGGSGAWLLVFEGATTGGDPDPIATGIVVAFDLAGFTPDLQVVFDRTPRTFGGARVSARLRDADFGFPVEGVTVGLSLVAPSPGGLSSSEPLPRETDADGEVSAVYSGPEDEADVGEDVEIRAEAGI